MTCKILARVANKGRSSSWENCRRGNRRCFRQKRASGLVATSVQCFARFWLWQSLHSSPFAKPHRHAHHLAYDFRILRML